MAGVLAGDVDAFLDRLDPDAVYETPYYRDFGDLAADRRDPQEPHQPHMSARPYSEAIPLPPCAGGSGVDPAQQLLGHRTPDASQNPRPGERSPRRVRPRTAVHAPTGMC